jgi:hypothetical protein
MAFVGMPKNKAVALYGLTRNMLAIDPYVEEIKAMQNVNFPQMTQQQGIMALADKWGEGFGVETLVSDDEYDGPSYSYVNVGDTYGLTLFRKHGTDWFFMSTVGDLIESDPRLQDS